MVYRAAWTLALPLARLAALGPGKLGRTVRGRLAARRQLVAWSVASRDTKRPLIWFHAASVGEGRQAESVMAELRRHRPAWQIAFTFSSASAEQMAVALPADVAAYLPPDTPADAGAVLDALAPAALVFSATDVWPELVAQARARRIPVALISANLGPASSRRGFLARALLRPAYAALAAVGAIDQRDAEALQALGVSPSVLSVTGDSRHDAVAARAAADDSARHRLHAMLAPGQSPLIVAGSTWPGDEAALLPALAVLWRGRVLRLVVAPHEPSPRALARLEHALDAALHGAVIRRLSDLEREAARGDAPGTVAWNVCVVDRVGVLFDLYAAAAVAYVGGGFHAAGLHSVIEPAVFGVPVLVGPRWQSSRDARLLLEAGAAASAPTSDALAQALRVWLDDTTARAAAGAAARAVVDRGLGAASRSAALIIELAERAPATTS